MFIKVHRYQVVRNNVMLLNTDNIASVIDRGTHLDIQAIDGYEYSISETFDEFWDMVHPSDPTPCEPENKLDGGIDYTKCYAC